ncbi:MBL fold metallo-hydrolase [Flavihumibacter sp. R14]|nr:MBL fold metallo-hydrolase [Flavihumibacter soli]
MSQKDRLVNSPNYNNGTFHNLADTPVMSPEASYFKLVRDMLSRPSLVRPSGTLPSVKTDLKSLRSEVPVVVWFGHSSYLIHCRGINILVDPVFSGHASPLRFMVKAFPGSDVYTLADMPKIDMVFITHNHYDHLDKKTVKKMDGGVKFYSSLGVGESLESFGIAADRITELDWWEETHISEDIHLTATPARHFSGRGIKRGGSLWCSFVLEIFGHKLYLGGDSGYGEHFKAIGSKFGPFDLAILDSGQYNTMWPLIHMMPEEAVQASIDLGAAVYMPVHWGKFALANHVWNEPAKRASKSALDLGVKITTPLIGEPVIVGRDYPMKTWWDIE